MSPALRTLGFDLPITRPVPPAPACRGACRGSPDLFLFFCFLSVLCGQLLMFFKIKFAYIRPYSRSFVTLLFFPPLTPFLCVERFCFCCAPCLRVSVVSFGFTS